jgi:Bacterial Ig domain
MSKPPRRAPLLIARVAALLLAVSAVGAGSALADPPPSPTCSAGAGTLYAHPGQTRMIYAGCTPSAYPSSATIDPPAHGTATALSNLTYEYTPAAGYAGPDAFTVHAADANGAWTPFTITLDVTTTGDTAPNCGLGNGGIEIRAGTTRSVTIGPCEDAEGDPMTYAIVTPPAHGTTGPLTPSSSPGAGPTVAFTAAADYVGTDFIGYAATDDFGQQSPTAKATLNIKDASSNTWPSCFPWWVFPGPGPAVVHGSKTVPLNCADADGDAITVTVPSPPAHGTITISTVEPRTITYTASPGYEGPDHLTITVARRDSAAAPGVTAKLPCTDPDGDPLTGRTFSSPGHGALTFDDAAGTLTYTPEVGYSGDDAVTISAADNRFGSAPLRTLHVLVVPPDPRGGAGARSAAKPSAAAFPVSAAAQAAALLGAKGKLLTLGLGSAVKGYASSARSVKPGAPLAVVLCRTGCTVGVDGKVVLGEKAKPIALAHRTLRVTAARPGVVRLALTKAQRARVARAKRPTITLTLRTQAGGRIKSVHHTFAIKRR